MEGIFVAQLQSGFDLTRLTNRNFFEFVQFPVHGRPIYTHNRRQSIDVYVFFFQFFAQHVQVHRVTTFLFLSYSLVVSRIPCDTFTIPLDLQNVNTFFAFLATQNLKKCCNYATTML